MTSLVLHGTVADRDQMARLCAAVGQLGYDCRLRLWTATGVASPDFDCEDAGDGGGATAAIEIICWTIASVGADGAAMQSHAVALKEEQRYLGLLLDAVAPPAAVTGAQDIALHDWEAVADTAALAPLQSALIERLEGNAASGGIGAIIAALFTQIKAIRLRVQRMHRSLKRLGVVAAFSLMLLLFGFLGGFEQNVAGICRMGVVAGLCRAAAIGDLPSQAELGDWARIEPGNSCAAFEDYLAQYGAKAEFADEAQLRIEQAQGALDERPMRVMRPISFAPEDRRPSRRAAIAALNARAQAEAISYCAITAQNFNGEARPGSYTITTEPDCVSDGERFDCEADGYIECAFMRTDQSRSCPPLTARSRN